MKKLLVVLLIQILTINATKAYIYWEMISFPDTLFAEDILINDKGYYFVIGHSHDDRNPKYNGIYLSTDKGATWEYVLQTNLSRIHSISINDKQEVFAAMEHYPYFWKSDTSGRHWEQLIILNDSTRNSFSTYIDCLGGDSLLIGIGFDEDVALLKARKDDYSIDYIADTLLHFKEGVDPWITKIQCVVSDVTHNTMFFSYGSMLYSSLYQSRDNGLTWTEIEIENSRVGDVAINSQGDAFIGLYKTFHPNLPFGLYALYKDVDTLTFCGPETSANRIVIDTNDNIIFSTYRLPNLLFYSLDIGYTTDTLCELFQNVGKFRRDKDNNLFIVDLIFYGILHKTASPIVFSELSNDKLSKLNIHPNPAVHNINVEIPQNMILPKLELTLMDIHGKIIIKRKIAAHNGFANIDVSDLVSGTYTLIVSDNMKLYESKFIKL